MRNSRIIVAFFCMFFCVTAVAQKYQPKDKWPYIYKEFTEGNVKTSRGALLENVKLNVSVANGTLHYIKDDTIMEIDMSTVLTAKVGEDVYMKASGQMMKVLAEVDGGAVLECTSLDFDEMNKTSIGYGISSSTASSQNVSVLLDNASDMESAMVNMPLYNATLAQETGTVIPVKTVRYIWAKGMVVLASKSDILEVRNVDKADFNAFLKANKIKWSSVESLALVAKYLGEL